MVILELYQNDFSKDLVVFDSLEEGKAFVAQIPGYTLEIEDGFEMEYFNPKIYRIIWKLSSMEILSLYLDSHLNLKKMSRLFGKKFRIYPNQTIK